MAAPQEMPPQRAAPRREEETVARFVAQALALSVRAVEPIPAGLGLRRFYRVRTDGDPATLVARVEASEDPAGRPPGVAPEPPLEPLRALLEGEGLPVPRRLGGSPDGSLLLLEDLGGLPLCDAPPESRESLVAEALALLPRLQRIAPVRDVAAFGRRLDAGLLAYKADLFARYSLPEALGRPPTSAEREAVRDAFGWIAGHAAAAPQRLAHRDFQSQNLLVVPPRADGSHIVMIDLQGAFLAPPEYDAVCLLRDSYLPLPDASVAHHLERLRPGLPDAPEPDVFAQRFDWLTLTRKGKDHARFLYGARERGDRRFLRHLAPTVRALRAAAERRRGDAPALARLADLVAQLPEGDPCEG